MGLLLALAPVLPGVVLTCIDNPAGLRTGWSFVWANYHILEQHLQQCFLKTWGVGVSVLGGEGVVKPFTVQASEREWPCINLQKVKLGENDPGGKSQVGAGRPTQ